MVRGSNPCPTDCVSDALATESHRQLKIYIYIYIIIYIYAYIYMYTYMYIIFFVKNLILNDCFSNY